MQFRVASTRGWTADEQLRLVDTIIGAASLPVAPIYRIRSGQAQTATLPHARATL